MTLIFFVVTVRRITHSNPRHVRRNVFILLCLKNAWICIRICDNSATMALGFVLIIKTNVTFLISSFKERHSNESFETTQLFLHEMCWQRFFVVNEPHLAATDKTRNRHICSYKSIDFQADAVKHTARAVL